MEGGGREELEIGAKEEPKAAGAESRAEKEDGEKKESGERVEAKKKLALPTWTACGFLPVRIGLISGRTAALRRGALTCGPAATLGSARRVSDSGLDPAQKRDGRKRRTKDARPGRRNVATTQRENAGTARPPSERCRTGGSATRGGARASPAARGKGKATKVAEGRRPGGTTRPPRRAAGQGAPSRAPRFAVTRSRVRGGESPSLHDLKERHGIAASLAERSSAQISRPTSRLGSGAPRRARPWPICSRRTVRHCV